jgi:hypothetical protein
MHGEGWVGKEKLMNGAMLNDDQKAKVASKERIEGESRLRVEL